MAKSTNKTTENNYSVSDFIKTVADPERQKDTKTLVNIMEKESGFKAKMWGTAIIGFGSYHYKYESGREGDAPLTAFSPRKSEFALYFSSRFDKREELLAKFGKHKTAKGCIYIKKISDIDVDVLKKMIANSIKYYKSLYK